MAPFFQMAVLSFMVLSLIFPGFSVSLVRKRVELGETLLLECPFRGNISVQWFRVDTQEIYSDGTDINPNLNETKSRLSVTGNHSKGEYNLLIERFEESDEGKYRCDTTNDGKAVSAIFLVTMPDSGNITINISENNSGVLLHSGLFVYMAAISGIILLPLLFAFVVKRWCMIIQKEHVGQSYRENHAFRLNQYEETGELENTHRSIVTLTRFSEPIYRNVAPVVVRIDGHS